MPPLIMVEESVESNRHKSKKRLREYAEEVSGIEPEDPVLSVFNKMENVNKCKVEADTNKVIENSIFDFVVEMEKQFDDMFLDIESIKELRRKD